ncbi:carbohydrate ABC transporter permease [Parenemella sanctibonifatiensis]|uniref:Sugar ABC transporter permease n=1 Tax=Parenemella sanctibonifatiensis TaxID=2016505 RepID=A0A255EGD5_9ACTN|nr:sugar ABC transporter permease [Parenemella sanctibonifatiensis]OYN88665.1 sugar ABC transporter permease [Parenemella sanctibonifatiensis]
MARSTSVHGDQSRLAYLLLAPSLVLLVLVVGIPLGVSVWQSLHTTSGGVDPETGFIQQGTQFVGLDNYLAIFSDPASSDAFWNAFSNTTLFTVVGVTLETVIGVVMALIMAQALRGQGLLRASILVPWAIPTIVSALVWRVIFLADGIFNEIIGTKILWATEGWQAQAAVIIADVWKTAPYIGLLTLAGLLTIDNQVYEAAKVDGSSRWSTFWRITLPLVRPVLVVAVLFRLLDAMRMFDLPYALLGRLESGQTLATLAQFEASQTNYGPAATYSLVLMAYIGLVAFLFVRFLGADVIGDDDRLSRKEKRAAAQAAKAKAAEPATGTVVEAGQR